MSHFPSDRAQRYWLAAAALSVLLSFVLLVLSCRPPKPGETYDKATAISCATASVKEAWPRAYPEVMHCLMAIMTNPISCLDAIPAALHVGVDTIACIVRGAEKEAGMQADQNTADVLSVRKAERARAWLDYRGVRFQPDPQQ